MKLSFPTLYDKIIPRRALLLTTAFILMLVSVFFISRMRTEENIMKLLPQNQEEIRAYQLLLDHFTSTSDMIILYGSREGGDPSQILRGADSLATMLQQSGHFSVVNWRWELSDLLAAQQLLKTHRERLYDAQDMQIIAGRLPADSIEFYLRQWKQALLESPAPFIAQQMLSDPLHFDDLLFRKMAATQAFAGAIQIHEGCMFSRDMQQVIILARPIYPAMDSERSASLVDFMDRTARSIRENAADTGCEIQYAGSHRFTVENAARLKHDAQLTVSISIIAIAILALLVYSRPLLSLLTLLPAFFGTGLALAVMSAFSDRISAIIIGSGAMLIGISVDYGIHFLFYVDQTVAGPDQKSKITGLVKSLYSPFVISALTTVIAFAVLLASTLPGYRQLAVFVSVGISASLIFVFFAIPHLVPRRQSQIVRRPTLPVASFFPHFFRISARYRRWIVILLIGLTLLFSGGLFRLQLEGDMQNFNSVSDKARQDWQTIQNLFGSALNNTSLIIESPDAAGALDRTALLDQKLRELQRQKIIASFSSISGLLPANRQQDENQQRWHNLFAQGNLEKLKADLNRTAAHLGFRPDAFTLFLDALADSSAPLSVDSFEGTLLEKMMANRLAITEKATFTLTTVTLAPGQSFQFLRSELTAQFPGLIVHNSQQASFTMIRQIFTELKRIGLLSLLAITVFLTIVYRTDWRTLLVLILPLLLCLIWTFGLMGWLGIKITLFSSIVSVFVFGVVVDYGIFLLSAFRHKEKDSHTSLAGAAIVLSAATTVLGLGALSLARHPALFSLGITAMLGVLFGLAAVLLVVPLYFHGK
jgi:predicted exporter